MFYFGDPEQSAALLVEEALLDGGPGIVDKHPDEMSLEELQWANTYLTVAWRRGMATGVAQDVLDALEAMHEPIFITLLQQSKDFRRFVLSKGHTPVGGKSFAEARAKARKMAKSAKSW